MKHNFLIFCVAALALTACTQQPIREAYPSMTPYDDETVYSIDRQKDGFTVNVVFSKHQFQPDMNALMTLCKNKLMNIAHEQAAKQRKKTKPFNEQRIKLDTNRNMMNGMSTCTASMPAEWK